MQYHGAYRIATSWIFTRKTPALAVILRNQAIVQQITYNFPISWLARQLTALFTVCFLVACFGRCHISHPHWRIQRKWDPKSGSKVSVLGSLPRCKVVIGSAPSQKPWINDHVEGVHTTTRSLTFPRKKNTKTTMVIHGNQVNWWSSKWGVSRPKKSL